jgi:hypothetical protein
LLCMFGQHEGGYAAELVVVVEPTAAGDGQLLAAISPPSRQPSLAQLLAVRRDGGFACGAVRVALIGRTERRMRRGSVLHRRVGRYGIVRARARARACVRA